jgi:CRP/FNR family transcriptional regulator, anaerobic regulatory protein
MPVDIDIIRKHIPFLEDALLKEIAAEGDWIELDAGIQILREGQYVKVIPIVMKGLVKVFTQAENRELLLYYIRPSESCIMSFSAILNNDPSKIFAITEEPSQLLLIPAEKIIQWLRTYPKLNSLFYQQYDQRYAELIETIHQLLFNRLDQRIYDYLQDLSKLKSNTLLQVKHRQIAQDLGTSREVITRTIRKLEKENKVRQTEKGIEIIS